MLSYSSSGLSGPAPLVSGRDYTCNSTICYGIGANHATLVKLQQMINKFAGAAAFKPISVDGKIGDGTTLAMWKTAEWIIKKGGAGATFTAGGKAVTKLGNDGIAANAPSLIDTLDFWSTAIPPGTKQPPKLPSSQPGPAVQSPIAPATGPVTSASSLFPDFPVLTQPSQGSFGPGTSPTTPGNSGIVPFTPAEPSLLASIPWWAWLAGGVVLVGGATTIALTRRKRRA